MPGIFISYRRDDSAASAGRLYDHLAHHFGKEQVFRDLDAIAPGAEFTQVIEERLSQCSVFVAVIGKNWVNVKNAAGQRRLDDPARSRQDGGSRSTQSEETGYTCPYRRRGGSEDRATAGRYCRTGWTKCDRDQRIPV